MPRRACDYKHAKIDDTNHNNNRNNRNLAPFALRARDDLHGFHDLHRFHGHEGQEKEGGRNEHKEEGGGRDRPKILQADATGCRVSSQDSIYGLCLVQINQSSGEISQFTILFAGSS